MKVDADRGKEGGEAGRSTCAIVPHDLRPCLGFHRVDDFCGRPQRSPKKGAGMSPGATSLRGWHVIRLPRGVNRANFERTSSTLSAPSFLPSSYSLYSFHRLMTRGGRKGLVTEFKSYFQKTTAEQPRDLNFLPFWRFTRCVRGYFWTGSVHIILIRDRAIWQFWNYSYINRCLRNSNAIYFFY